MSRQRGSYPEKRTMNLFYKPDRTTRPATAALYVLFTFTVLLGLSKVLVYDLWAEVRDAQRTLEVSQSRLEEAMAQLADYDQVLDRYRRYAATEEEEALVDRMRVLRLLDSAIGAGPRMDSVSINGDMVQVRVSGVTLAQTARIASALESSPIVERTVVTTASTTEAGDQVTAGVQVYLKKEEAEG